MSLLAPAALLFGFLAVPITLLYMLRLRRQERVISSTFLWRDLVLDRVANAPWQKLKRNLLLILQLLILAALVLALARPYIHADGQFDGNVIVILDSSASMTATDEDGGSSRFDEAVRKVNSAIDNLGGTDQMTLITAGAVPKVLISGTNDKSLLRGALATVTPEFSSADWPSAFSLAAGSAQGFTESEFVIISDGGLPDTMPPLPGKVSFIPLGRSGENIAISAMGTRKSGDHQELLVGLQNYGQSSGQGLVSVYLDGQLFDSRSIDIGGGTRNQLSWNLPPGTEVVEARFEPTGETEDFLAVDNKAWGLVDDQKTTNVLLVSDGNLFLERLFTVLPGYELTRVTETDLNGLAESDQIFDLYIFDGVPVPDSLPPGNVMIFDPQPGSEITQQSGPLQIGDVFPETTIVRVADDPRVGDVDWSNIHIAQARAVTSPALESLVEAEGGNLLLTGEFDGRKVAVFPFDLAKSDLPLQIAFPIVMANIIGWLNPGYLSISTEIDQPGEAVSIVPDPRTQTLSIRMPDGGIWEQVITDASAPVVFPNTDQPGIYTIFYRNNEESDRSVGRFGVNFNSPNESRINPGASIQIGQDEIGKDSSTNVGRVELWPYLLFIGLILIMLEWWITYQSGARRRVMKLQ